MNNSRNRGEWLLYYAPMVLECILEFLWVLIKTLLNINKEVIKRFILKTFIFRGFTCFNKKM